jgi:hypothetical protein
MVTGLILQEDVEMRRTLIVPFPVGSALMYLLFAGCSSPPQVPPPEPEAEISPIAQFCAAVAEPFCEASYACCLDDFMREFTGYGTVDECKAMWRSSGCLGTAFSPSRQASLQASLDAGSTVFDQATLDACIARLKPLAEGGAACVEPAGSILDTACLSAFRGQIAPGERCSWPAEDVLKSFMQCKDGFCMDGTCVPFLKLGDACSFDKAVDAPANEICNYPAGEWCWGESASEPGTCQPQGDVGDACYGYTITPQCKTRYCDVTSNTCGPATFQAIACGTY